MDIGEFLSLRCTDLPSVVAEVDATLGLDADVLLLAVGSVAEGLGNAKSDLDLIMVAPDADARAGSSDEVNLVVGRCLIDVLVVGTTALEALLDRFRAWCRRPWDVTRAAGFTFEERTLLHRMRHGHTLAKGERNDVVERMPSLTELARLKLHVARHLARTIQVDIVGYREVEDYRTLVFAAQDLLGQAADALAAGHRLTNPNPKWRSRLLDLVPADWERALAARPTGLTAGERVWRLHRAPERPEELEALEQGFAITSFARAVFVWAEHQLVQGPDTAHAAIVWPPTERNERSAATPVLDLDVDFMLGDGWVAVARLNEFGQALKLSPDEFDCALLLDGTATGRRDGAMPSIMDRVVSEVARAGLSVSWPSRRVAG